MPERELWRAALQARAAVQKAPGTAAAHAALGVVLSALGHHPAALDALRRAVRLDPHNPNHAFNLGVATISAGQVDAGLSKLAHVVATAGPLDGPRLAQRYAEICGFVTAASLYTAGTWHPT